MMEELVHTMGELVHTMGELVQMIGGKLKPMAQEEAQTMTKRRPRR